MASGDETAAVDSSDCVDEYDEVLGNSVESQLGTDEEFHNIEPNIGIEFKSEEAARIFYNEYARCTGFSVRVRFLRRSKRDGSAIGREFVCSKEGFREQKYKNNRPITRVGCKAMIKLKKAESGKWVVTNFIKDHNHDLVSQKMVHLLRSHKHSSGLVRNLGNLFKGTRSCSVFSISEEASRRSELTDFTLGNSTDYIQNIRKQAFRKYAQSFLENLSFLQARNPYFFYAVQTDEDYHITNIFWCDARSRMAYRTFGDVVTFETSYPLHRYNLPFASFLGVNHHKQPILFGCALLLVESELSFMWVFSTWLKAMSGHAPQVMITEYDLKIQTAVRQVLPCTIHHFCKRNIIRKLPEIFGNIYYTEGHIKGDFLECMGMDRSDEFDACWSLFLDKYGLKDNVWLQSLFENREKWMRVYLQEPCSTNMSSDEEDVSLDPFFDGFINADTSLEVLLNQCDKAVNYWCEKEAEEDLRTNFKKPNLKTGLPMENQVAKVYTGTLFMKFQEELFLSLRYIADVSKDDGQTITFDVSELGVAKKAHVVTFNVSEVKARCSCKKFECSGILCRHVLRVFNVKNILLIPSHYILKRWTRYPMSDEFANGEAVQVNAAPEETWLARFNDLCDHAIKIAMVGASSDDTYTVALHTLRKVVEDAVVVKTNGNNRKYPISPDRSSVQIDNICEGRAGYNAGDHLNSSSFLKRKF